jgi:hypothetical protein
LFFKRQNYQRTVKIVLFDSFLREKTTKTTDYDVNKLFNIAVFSFFIFSFFFMENLIDWCDFDLQRLIDQ